MSAGALQAVPPAAYCETVAFPNGAANEPEQQAMSDEGATGDLMQRILRDIQREPADMRDDRTVILAVLNRLDASVTSLSAEMRALRSQFDRFRDEVRERLQEGQH